MNIGLDIGRQVVKLVALEVSDQEIAMIFEMGGTDLCKFFLLSLIHLEL